MSRSLLVHCLCLFGVYLAAAVHARASEAVRREKQVLAFEAQQLRKILSDLRSRQDDLEREEANLRKRVAAIYEMPPGSAQQAALDRFRRELDRYNERSLALERDFNLYRATRAQWDARHADQARRVKVVRSASRFRSGDRVMVEWKGQWWKARVLRVQNGNYFITYDGYGSEWDEWVGNNRIRRR
jgi:hypothetical protein